MNRKLRVFTATAVVLTVTGSAIAAGSTRANRASVDVQQKPSIAGNIQVSFRPADRLPDGGYYYAVIVLKQYKHYTSSEPPPCATSSKCGVVAKPKLYRYPDGLPTPLAKGTRIVGRFQVAF